MDTSPEHIAVIVPCYRVRPQILDVLGSIGPEVESIYVVDDACPEDSGRWVEENCDDLRVKVLFHEENTGVGGAVITGYRRALEDGATILVKLDGDGQMDGRLIPRFVRPILEGEADYTKGNRFFSIEHVAQMPAVRLGGNAILSIITKLASGYWDLFDFTNGFTAIHGRVCALLPLDKISRRFFFESDMLFRLNTLRAVVVEIPIPAQYRDERSNLRVSQVIFEFLAKDTLNLVKRIVYNYYLRSFNIASIYLVLGVGATFFGSIFGAYHWYLSWATGVPASSGTVMVAGLPILVGVQFLLAFLGYDIQSVPRRALHRRMQ